MNMRCIGRFAAFSVLGLLLALPSQAAFIVQTDEAWNDNTGGKTWEIYGIDYDLQPTTLHVNIRANLKKTGESGSIGHGNENIKPGDLYINIGGSHVAKTGSVYGLALTTHSGDQTTTANWDNGLAWKGVTAGHLYGGATFATGTYEDYPHAGVGMHDYDGGLDPQGKNNNYPALIADWSTQLTAGQSVFTPVWASHTATAAEPWKYVIQAQVDRGLLGLTNTTDFELWYSHECGNDAAWVRYTAPKTNPVPEPASFGFLGLGALLLRRRRKSTTA